ncbi:hypothetical protein JK182_02620 [Acetobacter okinawensis]|uniref:hypothetical protein n=1 Tax=Acetobacter okinawensis TaxID=1076594 RepID=UPI001BA60994|nr:hypothetical protein [Acetobacter okinawensis]MBS0987586.1 hypothetical protein [Acetobacter okinawensis]
MSFDRFMALFPFGRKKVDSSPSGRQRSGAISQTDGERFDHFMALHPSGRQRSGDIRVNRTMYFSAAPNGALEQKIQALTDTSAKKHAFLILCTQNSNKYFDSGLFIVLVQAYRAMYSVRADVRAFANFIYEWCIVGLPSSTSFLDPPSSYKDVILATNLSSELKNPIKETLQNINATVPQNVFDAAYTDICALLHRNGVIPESLTSFNGGLMPASLRQFMPDIKRELEKAGFKPDDIGFY